jgi:hypothetical protein
VVDAEPCDIFKAEHLWEKCNKNLHEILQNKISEWKLKKKAITAAVKDAIPVRSLNMMT